MLHVELHDINNDGYLDLIMGGANERLDTTDNLSQIIYGDGGSFVGNESVSLPESEISGFGIVTDLNFYDLDDDGTDEIIITRSGDRSEADLTIYQGWLVQVIQQNDQVLLTELLILSMIITQKQKMDRMGRF